MIFLLIRSLILWILLTTSSGQQCKNDLGEPVDWILGYKPPAMKSQGNPLLRKGVGYIYVTSKDPTADWKLSSKSVNDSTSFLGRTLSILYTDSSKNYNFLMYNDEPPSTPASTIYGHSKGVVITVGKVGFWLVHSSPKFPIEPVTVNKENSTTTKNKYFFPKTATRFGQSFLCITLPPNQMDKVGLALQYIKPKIYGQNTRSGLGAKLLQLTLAANGKYKKNGPWTLKTPLKTLGGKDFISYAKSKEFNKDLYSDWLAPDLKSDIQVETWSNGPNELPSDCKSTYHVMDVKDVEIKVENQIIRFKNSKDHSKWAVTVNSNITTVCIGDINRMLAQFKRGGGIICYEDAFVWKKYAKAVADVQPCTVNPVLRQNILPDPQPPVNPPIHPLYPNLPYPILPDREQKNSTYSILPYPVPPQENPTGSIYPVLPNFPTPFAGENSNDPKNNRFARAKTDQTTTESPEKGKKSSSPPESTTKQPKTEKKKSKSFISSLVDKLFGLNK